MVIGLLVYFLAFSKTFAIIEVDTNLRKLDNDDSSDSYLLEYSKRINDFNFLSSKTLFPRSSCEKEWSFILKKSFTGAAFKYWNSFAVPLTGLAEGKTLFIGQPEQCVNAKTGYGPVNIPSFPDTKPFLLQLSSSSNAPNLSLTVRVGVCMPASCSNAGVAEIFGLVLDGLELKVSASSQSEFEADAAFYIATFIFTTLLLLVVSATSYATYKRLKERYDVAKQYVSLDHDDLLDKSSAFGLQEKTEFNQHSLEEDRPNKAIQFLLCFDFYANFSKIMAPPNQSVSQLCVLNGIRAMSMSWVILAHTGLHELTSGVQDNPLYMVELGSNFLFQGIANASLSVDTFFVLSGFLAMMGTLKALEKPRDQVQFWALFYVHRLMRLWPALLLTMLFIVGLYPTLAAFFYSPLFQTDSYDSISQQCRGTYWMSVAFFYNNFDGLNDPNRKPCMSWTWYLADDFQFYAISPVFILLVKRNRQLGVFVTSLCMLASTLFILIVSAMENVTAQGNPLTVLQSSEIETKWTDRIYEWPFMRFQIYAVGLLLGVVFHEQEAVKARFHRFSLNARIAIVTCMWLFAFVGSGLAVYGCYPSLNGDPMSTGEAALYNALFRLLWAFCIAILILLCAWGYGGVVNSGLGSNFWVPLGRVGYTTYIIHVVLIWLWLDSAEASVRFSTIYFALKFTGMATCVYCVAIVASCVIEAPFIQMEKLLIGRGA